MKHALWNIPDWVGTAIVGICASLITGAFMWGTLRSEVSAQVTAQSTDASDIKQLISSQAGLVATVKAMAEDQKQLHGDVLAMMNAYGSSRNNAPSLNTGGVR